MGIFSKKEKMIKCRFAHLEGVVGMGKGTATDVILNDAQQAVEFKMPLSKTEPKLLKYDKIKNVRFYSEKEIIEKSKSVVGRAVVGGALLGGVGAVVGGMSGIGDKKEEKRSSCIDIEYSDKDGEVRHILLELVGASIGWDKFLKYLNEKANIKTEQSNYL